MKDFRSLESKIRAVVEGRQQGAWVQVTENEWIHPVAGLLRYRDGDGKIQYFNDKMEEVAFVEDSNDAKRIAQPIVGRPDTAKSPVDPKAKLNKQAQIKTKIIDEAKDAPPKDKGKDKKKDPPKDKKDAPADKDKDNDDDKDDKPKQSDEKPFGKDKPDESKPAGKNDSPTKADKPATKDNSAEIRKVADGNDTKDPKKITGGKTQVDTHPKTDDKVDNDSTGKKPDKKDVKETFSEDELKYFETILNEDYVDMSKKNVDAVINAKGKPHKVYTATDETRHGISVDELKRHLGISDSTGVHKKFMHNLHTAGIRTGWSHSSGKWIAYHGPKI